MPLSGKQGGATLSRIGFGIGTLASAGRYISIGDLFVAASYFLAEEQVFWQVVDKDCEEELCKRFKPLTPRGSWSSERRQYREAEL